MNNHLPLGVSKKHVALRCAGSALFALTCLLMSGPLQAAGKCYKAQPIDRKPIAQVCRVMEANLNEYCHQPPMVCELKVHERYAHLFSFPVWEDLTAITSMEVLERLIKLPYLSNPNPDAARAIWAEEEPGIEAAKAAGHLKISKSYLDLYNSGISQTVYRYSLNDCEEKNKYLHSTLPDAWRAPLATPTTQYVVSENDFALLKKRYAVVMPSGVGRGDIFSYGGNTFVYYMFSAGGKSGVGSKNIAAVDGGVVSQMGGRSIAGVTRICEFSYTYK